MAFRLFSPCFFMCAAAVFILILMSSSPSSCGVQASGTEMGWFPTISRSSSSRCKGTIAECLAAEDGEEFELDSEISRRILATSKYISYGALQRNTVPCSRRGASYYNCRPGAQANPYTRGCSAIARCRS